MDKKEQLKYINQAKKAKEKLKSECHDLWRELVYKRARYKCEFPGCRKDDSERLNPHHIFSKGAYPNMRYEPNNGMCLCVNHHTFGKEAAHTDIDFKEKILGLIDGYKAVRTEQWYTLLKIQAETSSKIDLYLTKLYLEQELKQYDN